MGINFRRVGNLDESIKKLTQAIDNQPGKAQAHNNLGLSFFEDMQPRDALDHFQKAIQYEQQACNELGLSKEYLSLFLNNKGLALYHTNQLDEAIQDYNEAINCVNGTNPENFFNRGNVYLRQQDFPKAHDDFDTAI